MTPKEETFDNKKKNDIDTKKPNSDPAKAPIASERIIKKEEKKEKIQKITAKTKNGLHKINDVIRLQKLTKEELDDVGKVMEALIPKPMTDERIEITEVLKNETINPELRKKLRKNADSTVLVINKDILDDCNEKEFKITAANNNALKLKDRKIVIAGEKKPIETGTYIGDQISVKAYGTGFIYKDENKYYIITAAHVLLPYFSESAKNQNDKLYSKDLRFVQNYRVKKENEYNEEEVLIEKSDVFKPKDDYLDDKNFYLSSYGDDWAIVEIVLLNENQIKLSDDKVLSKSDLFDEELKNIHVYGLGHGLGLPLKISPNGKILSLKQFNNSTVKHFACEIDFFSGNSGSPLFDSDSHKLLGFLVRGKSDFYFNEDKKGVTPGVLAGRTSGEMFQKTNFIPYQISKINGKGKNQPRDDEEVKPQTATYPQELLIYTNLNKSHKKFELNIFIPGAEILEKDSINKANRIGEIHFIYLKIKEGNKERKKSSITIEMDAPEDPKTTNETIEIRVFHKQKELFHSTTLEFINSFKNNKLYWATCLPKEFYQYTEDQELNESIGISLGYFEKDEFKKSALTLIDTVNLNNVGLKFIAENEYLKELKLNKKDESIEIDDLTITFSSINGNGIIKKSGHIGGRNPKPSRFIFYDDKMAGIMAGIMA